MPSPGKVFAVKALCSCLAAMTLNCRRGDRQRIIEAAGIAKMADMIENAHDRVIVSCLHSSSGCAGTARVKRETCATNPSKS